MNFVLTFCTEVNQKRFTFPNLFSRVYTYCVALANIYTLSSKHEINNYWLNKLLFSTLEIPYSLFIRYFLNDNTNYVLNECGILSPTQTYDEIDARRSEWDKHATYDQVIEYQGKEK